MDTNLKSRIRNLIVLRIGRFISDRNWVRFLFFLKFKRPLNLKNPKTFNEKLQWLKLYYHNPNHVNLVDKYEMKEYLSRTIGADYLIPVLGVWDDVDSIDFSRLPKRFVLKTTHDSGGVFICKDKASLDVDHVKRVLKKRLNTDYYIQYREWPYKYVKPRIIAEEYLEDESGNQLRDYKVFNFNGEPYCIQVDFDRFTQHKKNLYSTDWKLLDFSFNYPSHPEISIPKPPNLEEMLHLSRLLSKDEPYVRTDFYCAMGKTYIGEITFFPASGLGKFVPRKYDEILGNMILLPQTRMDYND